MANALSKHEWIEELWHRGELKFKLHSGQKLIYDKLTELPPSARQVVFLCGRRFGKSYLTLILALEACLKRPKRRILLCAPYKLQASEIAGPLMAAVTSDMPPQLITRHRSSHRWNFSNGSTLILSGLDLVAETIRGQEFDDIYLEETGSASPHDFLYTINSILFPTLLTSRGRIFHVTTLSKLEDHPLHTDILPKADVQDALFMFPTSASPLYTAEQLSEMCEEVGGPDSITWKREFECRQVRDDSLVAVPEFETDTVVKEFEMPSHFKSWVGGDWGGVRDKTALIFLAYDFERAKILVFDEVVYDKHTTTATVIDSCKETERKWEINPPRYVDAPGQLQIDLMRDHKFGTTFPSKDGFEASVNLVRTHIGKVEIHPRCLETIKTLKYARLNKSRTDFERTEALGHADCLMALCYGLRYINRGNPFPSLADNTHLGSHYVPKDYREPRTSAAAAYTLRSLFKVT